MQINNSNNQNFNGLIVPADKIMYLEKKLIKHTFRNSNDLLALADKITKVKNSDKLDVIILPNEDVYLKIINVSQTLIKKGNDVINNFLTAIDMALEHLSKIKK